MNQSKITILVVDDYAVVRQGLAALIDTAADMVVVGEAGDGVAAVQQARELRPDVIVMDLLMPGLDGIEALKQIRQVSPRARILVLTNFGEEQRVLAAFRAGAHGYLLKDAGMTDVIEAIRDVNKGRLALHPSLTKVLMQAIQPDVSAGPTKKGETAEAAGAVLTAREREVLRLLAQGLANRDIARILHIDERTVRIHVSHILGKLGLDNRTQAALYALRHDLASLDD